MKEKQSEGNGFMGGFWILAIVVVVFGFVYLVIKMGLRHAENIKRIEHGYPLLDGSVPKDEETRREGIEEKRIQ